MDFRLLAGRRRRRGQGGAYRLGPFEQWPKPAMAQGQLRLSLQQFAYLCFHKLLVEQLPAGDAVDLRAQRRDAVLISLLHARLPRRGRPDQVVAQHEIGGSHQVAHCERGKCRAGKHRQPGSKGEVLDVVAAGDDHHMRLFAPAEHCRLTSLFHGTELP